MAHKPTDPQVDEHSLAAQALVKQIIAYIGDDPERDGVKDTPARVVRSWDELFGGYRMDPAKILGTTFESSGYDQMVICKDIEMFSTCEHHMIPFVGKVHIGYVPTDRVVGLSKLARLVEIFSRRLQIQEKMTEQIADALVTHINPKGVMVVVSSKHFCMCARGVQKQHSEMVTSAIRGVFTEPNVRSEFLGLIRS